MLSGFFIFDWVNEQIHRFLLFVDSGIYWLASECYQLFVKLAQTRIFEDNFFSDFAKRIYAILGVFMLFYLAYALLMAIVDPDKLSKGDKSAGRIAANLVVSLVLLGFLPSIFNYAYRLQNYILSSNLIGTLVLGTAPIEVNTGTDSDEEVTGREEDTTTIDSSILSYGDVLSFTILNVFLNSDNVNVVVGETDDHQDYTWYDLKADIFENSNYSALPGMAEAVSTGSTVYGTGQEIVVDYKIIISTAAGIFLVYIMFSFALDLGVRVVKLAFYQLIAPLPVILRIIPSKKSVFEKWLKQTVSVYLEVFIRVAIMYMAIYFIHGIMANDTLGELWDAGVQGKLALAIVIMGILVFAKQASKMISDLFGIETGGLKLGIGEKLKAGGFFAAGSALGAAVASRGNPFAVARAWSKGMKDGNFKAIGEERVLRHKVLQASRDGSTWIGRRMNDVRGYFGFDTTADHTERYLEYSTPYLDAAGNVITPDRLAQLKENKERAKGANAEIDEKIRIARSTIVQQEAIQKHARASMDNAKDAVNKVDSTLTRTLTDYGYGSVDGNLSSLKSFVNDLDKQGVDVEALRAQYTSPSGVFYEDAFNDELKIKRTEHNRIMLQYRQQIEELEKDLTKEQITEVLAGSITDPKTMAALKQLKAANGGIAPTDGAQVKQMRDDSTNAIDDVNASVQSLELEKRTNTETIAQYDRIEADRKQRIEEAKNSGKFQSQIADKNARGSGK